MEQAVALALAGGATIRFEARVWAAIDLLSRPGRRHDGLALARVLSSDLAISGTSSETVLHRISELSGDLPSDG